MAVGARLLAKKQAIITRLSAIEELAGVDILCSDKTGTLTLNKLTLGDPFMLKGSTADEVILYAALASRAEDKDTIDLAVIGGVKDQKTLKACQVLHFQPFDPGTQAHRSHGERRGRKAVLRGQRRATGDSPDVRQCRRGEGCRREGRQRVRSERLPVFRSRPRRSGKPMADGRRAAFVRRASPRCQSHDRERPSNGCQRQDGYRRSNGDR